MPFPSLCRSRNTEERGDDAGKACDKTTSMKNQTAEGTSGKAGGRCRFAWKTVHKQRDFTLREWGGFCLFLKKKKMERGNKLNHILVCTKLIMVSKPYKILHYIQLSQFSLQNRKMGKRSCGAWRNKILICKSCLFFSLHGSK